jgi:hypothetical protein
MKYSNIGRTGRSTLPLNRARIGMTFGEDADPTSRLALAYIRGFRGTELDATSVVTRTKHFPAWLALAFIFGLQEVTGSERHDDGQLYCRRVPPNDHGHHPGCPRTMPG